MGKSITIEIPWDIRQQNYDRDQPRDNASRSMEPQRNWR
jgi:hypothetical protein